MNKKHLTKLRMLSTMLFVALFPFCASAEILSKKELESTIVKEEKPSKSFFKEKLITRKLWGEISQNDLNNLKTISANAQNGGYKKAKLMAENFSNRFEFKDILNDFILWNQYKRGFYDTNDSSFAKISTFILENDFYPDVTNIRKNAEKIAILEDIKYEDYTKYLQKYQPILTSSKLHILRSKVKLLNNSEDSSQKDELEEDVTQSVTKIWEKEMLTEGQEKEFLVNFQSQLSQEDYFNRIDYLLWNNEVGDAKKIINFVNEDARSLFNAIVSINKETRYIDKIILSVPRKLRDNEHLNYQRISWYHKNKQSEDAFELFSNLKAPTKYPEKWWSLRKFYFREAVKSQDYKNAYKIISRHGLPVTSADFWEAEWSAGWVSLRFLDKPEAAYTHFMNLYKNVKQPIAISRATYWLGMSAYAMGNKEKAIDWYKIAAKYPIFFYGQLAIHKHKLIDNFGAKNDIILPETPNVTKADLDAVSKMKSVKTAYILALIGERKDALEIFKNAIKNAETDGQIAIIVKVVAEVGDAEFRFRISREAGRRNVFFIKDDFKIMKEVPSNEYSPLVHAIIKQESGFVQHATSIVGALGFMQIMPGTAQLVAKSMKLPYSKQRLISDMNYNITLGSYYIKSLIDQFEGSEIMAIASYNAGPGSANRWAREFFDPRQEKDLDKVVDWIELITYSETRNYVQRVMENLIVYKYLIYRQGYSDVR